MPTFWIYICFGVAYWVVVLATHGERASVRNLSPALRLRVHATALLLSTLLWPIALSVALSRRLSR